MDIHSTFASIARELNTFFIPAKAGFVIAAGLNIPMTGL